MSKIAITTDVVVWPDTKIAVDVIKDGVTPYVVVSLSGNETNSLAISLEQPEAEKLSEALNRALDEVLTYIEELASLTDENGQI